MPKLTIDNREIEVPPGTTVLGAARQLGIDIPTLCYLEGCEPATSCLVCVVKINGNRGSSPPCGTAAVEGMKVESETAEVHAARRTALELLLERSPGRLPGAVLFRLSGGNGHPHDAAADCRRRLARGDRHGEARHRAAGRAGADLPGAVRKGVPPRAAWTARWPSAC